MKKVLVIDKRDHTGGNIYCENVEGINVHKYGAHIFHTSNQEVWDYVNRYVSFNHYVNSPVARFEDKLYNLPFNMNTFYQLWGVTTPQQAKDRIAQERAPYADLDPKNLEEQALFLDPDLTLAKIARKVGIPARQISAAINRTASQNVSQWVNHYRIEHAKKLLATTSAPITQIYLDSGFQTKSNFHREFSRLTKQTPSAYRDASRLS